MLKNKSIIIPLLCAILIWATTVQSAETYGNFSNVEYIKNYDGDTFTANIVNVHPIIGSEINIRIYGIDTPEIRGGCDKSKQMARQAKLLLASLLQKASNIELRNCKRDKYFRIVAEVYADNLNIAQTLLDAKLATIYFGETKKDWCGD